MTTVIVDVSDFYGNLDVALRLFDTAGKEIARSDPSDSFDAALRVVLDDADYFVVVSAAGSSVDVGAVFTPSFTAPTVFETLDDATAAVTIPVPALAVIALVPAVSPVSVSGNGASSAAPASGAEPEDVVLDASVEVAFTLTSGFTLATEGELISGEEIAGSSLTGAKVRTTVVAQRGSSVKVVPVSLEVSAADDDTNSTREKQEFHLGGFMVGLNYGFFPPRQAGGGGREHAGGQWIQPISRSAGQPEPAGLRGADRPEAIGEAAAEDPHDQVFKGVDSTALALLRGRGCAAGWLCLSLLHGAILAAETRSRRGVAVRGILRLLLRLGQKEPRPREQKASS
jgi:hypothetical protein